MSAQSRSSSAFGAIHSGTLRCRFQLRIRALAHRFTIGFGSFAAVRRLARPLAVESVMRGGERESAPANSVLGKLSE
jgi:hypothetical protein